MARGGPGTARKRVLKPKEPYKLTLIQQYRLAKLEAKDAAESNVRNLKGEAVKAVPVKARKIPTAESLRDDSYAPLPVKLDSIKYEHMADDVFRVTISSGGMSETFEAKDFSDIARRTRESLIFMLQLQEDLAEWLVPVNGANLKTNQ